MADETFDSSFFEDPFGGQSGSFTAGNDATQTPPMWNDWYGGSDPFGGQGGSFFDAGQPMLFDTQTGQYVTYQQAQQLDPMAFQQALYDPQNLQLMAQADAFNAENNLGLFTGGGDSAGAQQEFLAIQRQAHPEMFNPMTGQLMAGAPMAALGRDYQSWLTGQPMSATPSTGGGLFEGKNLGALTGLGLGGLTTLLGAAGVIQQLTQGDQATKQIVQRAVAAASPEERASFTAALEHATGGPSALGGRLAARAPGEEAAYTQGVQALQGLPTPGVDLYRMLSPTLLRQVGDIAPLQTQALQHAMPSQDLTDQLRGTAQLMAQGRLPDLDPQMVTMLERAYASRQADIDRSVDANLQSALERARQQGFSGGLDVLNGAKGALLAPSLAEAVRQRSVLMGERQLQELQLRQTLPLLATQLEAGRLAPASQHAQLFNTPMALTLQSLQNMGATAFQQPFDQGRLLQSLGATSAGTQAELIAALAGLNRSQTATRGFDQTQTTMTPSTGLIGAFAPTAQLLGGTGALLKASADAGLLS